MSFTKAEAGDLGLELINSNELKEVRFILYRSSRAPLN